MVRNEAVSLVLGYLSILSWLGAQFPQIVVNVRRKSVDGLALPFLANWLLGDTANLVGCLLTNQLPFQTYLATYFVFVDSCLIIQYIHYDAPKDAKKFAGFASQSARESRTSLLLPAGIVESPEAFTPYRRLAQSRSRSYSADPSIRAANVSLTLGTTEVPQEAMPMNLDIDKSQTRQRAVSLEGLPESMVAEPRSRGWAGGRPPTNDDASDDIPAAMYDSFRSEGGGDGSRGKHVSWRGNPVQEGRPVRARSRDSSPTTVRAHPFPYPHQAGPQLPPSASGTERPQRERRESAASAISRRSASIVFLGIFALFGFSSQSSIYTSKATHSGTVLNSQSHHSSPSLSLTYPVFINSDPPQRTIDPYLYSSPLPEPGSSSTSFKNDFNMDFTYQKADYTSQNGYSQQVIGRIAAWTCTTLYITSRLPQIWKNYARKSVEGLSMYLFTFAFCGNLFYVLSILLNPKMDLPAPLAEQYLRDSIPYLLGSGGTLMFDVTIILQSFIYAPRRRLFRSRARRRSWASSINQEERGRLIPEEEES